MPGNIPHISPEENTIKKASFILERNTVRYEETKTRAAKMATLVIIFKPIFT